jgi:hypothetical protein
LVSVMIRGLRGIGLPVCFRIRTDTDAWFGPSRVRVN